MSERQVLRNSTRPYSHLVQTFKSSKNFNLLAEMVSDMYLVVMCMKDFVRNYEGTYACEQLGMDGIESEFLNSGLVNLIDEFVKSNDRSKQEMAVYILNTSLSKMPRVCEAVAERDAIAKYLMHCVKNERNTPFKYFANETLGAMSYRTLRPLSSVDSARDKFIQMGLLDFALADLSAKNSLNVFGDMLIIANLVGTSEATDNTKLIVSEHIVDTLMTSFKEEKVAGALTPPSSFFPSLTKLSVNDANKKAFVANKIFIPAWIEKLDRIMKDKYVLTQMLETMLNLSLLEVNQPVLREKGVIQALDKINASQYASEYNKIQIEKIKWKLKPQIASPAVPRSVDKENKEGPLSVMISYNWDNQPVVVQLADELKRLGFNVWLDLDQMVGSTVEAMAEAVEGSDAFVMCMSRKYKESANCRLEGEYAFKKKKAIIPIMMQDQYDADGWLGAILGTKLWYKVTVPEHIDAGVKGIVKELTKLRPKGALPTPPPVLVPVPASAVPAESKKAADSVDKWSSAQVEQWLTTIGLKKYTSIFKEQHIEGRGLIFLAKLLNAKTPVSDTVNSNGLITNLLKVFESVGDYMIFAYELQKLI